MIIPLSGINMAESDYTTPDGSLDCAINAIPRGGALNNFRLPDKICQLDSGERIVALHTVDSTQRLICLHGDGTQQTLRWRDMAGSAPVDIIKLNGFADIAIIGNTLAVADAQGLHYILYRQGQYISLGAAPEFPAIEFGLRYPQAFRSWKGLDDSADVTISKWLNPGGDHRNWDAEQYKTDCANFSNAIYGLLLPAVNDKIISQGYFYQPFFVRYAFRLYDGSYRWHSAPVLMIPTGTPPHVKIDVQSDTKATATLDVLYFELCYKFTNQPDYSAWRDIITAIDIFISAPIYTYDQAATIISITSRQNHLQREAVGRKEIPTVKQSATGEYDGYLRYYHTGNYSTVKGFEASIGNDVFTDHYINGDTLTGYCADIPRNENFHEQVINCANFYFAMTIDPFRAFEDAPAETSEGVFPDPDKASKLPYWTYSRVMPKVTSTDALVASQRLPDEYQSHFSLLPKLLHVYNSRLNLANLDIRPPHPYPVRAYKSASGATNNQCWAVTTVRSSINGTEVVSRNADIDRSPAPFITAQKGDKYRANLYGGNWWSRHGLSYIYVPDPQATSLEVSFYESSSPDRPTKAYTFPLTPHPLLNGAYWYGQLVPSVANPQPGDNDSAYDDPKAAFAADISAIATKAAVPSKLYTSEVNNPFLFQAANITTIGTGTIVALASAAKPLSQGQFGQFPLYAFTTEGIWALEVSATGGFASRQPVSRDVCLGPQSVTPVDSAVLFATSRGIMMISGGEINCISHSLYNPDVPITDPCQLRLGRWVILYNGGAAPSADKVGLPDGDLRTPSSMLQYKLTTYFSMPSIADMLADCRLFYSYATQLLYVYRPGDPKDTTSHFAYVFSFDSRQWGGAMISIVDSFDSYPHAYAVIRESNVTGGPEASIRPPQVGEPLPVLPPTVSSGPETVASAYFLADFDRPHKLSVMFALTRPLKFAAPDTFKTLLEVHARGRFPRDAARIVVFGAREITGPWVIVGSSKTRRLHRIAGSPYKYFRIGVFLDPHIDGNSLSALEVSFIRRYPRRLR